jgi:cytochrome b561
MTAATTATARYSLPAIVLHWLIFALIAAGAALAFYMTDLPLSPLKLKYYSWHKWIGVSIFIAAVVRLLWRLCRRAPALPAAMPAWQQRAAHALHGLLYVLLFAIPLSGWLYSSAAGVPTVYFGVIPLPDLLERDKALAETLKAIHEALNYMLFTLVAAHAGAALKHHFIDGDDVLAHMLPFAKLRRN